MSNQGYYGQPYGQPPGHSQYPQYPPQAYNQQPPYYPQQPMQYQQPPQQVVVREKRNRGCLEACLATLCCCFVCEEGCDTCIDCCECAEGCC